MKLLDSLALGMGEGAPPHVLNALIDTPGTPLTARQVAEVVPYSESTVKRTLDRFVLARFIQGDNGTPRRYQISHAKAQSWCYIVRNAG